MPETARVDRLNAEHPHYTEMKDAWSAFDLLYRGGKAIQDQASRFLTKRPRELNDIYLNRVARFTYSEDIGQGLGWYTSKLFRKDPQIDIRLKGKDSTAKVPESKTSFYTDTFLLNCDRAGTTYVDTWRQIFLSMALYKEAFVCVDLPRANGDAKTLLQQKAQGGLDPYLMPYTPTNVINWETDDYGNLNWVVIKVTTATQEFLGQAQKIDRWYFYDRKEFRVYEAKEQKQSGNEQAVQLVGPSGLSINAGNVQQADLIARGPHSLSGQNRVPVRRLFIPDSLWLTKRVFLPTLNHINMYNAYFWALFMANMAIPIIKSDTDFTQTLSETAYIKLDKDASFEWTEPKGTSFEVSADCIQSEREGIYRLMYLQAQARDSSATASSSSGYAKEMDMMPSLDILSQFGDILRAGMQALLQDVALVRGDDDIEFDVNGFVFDKPAIAEVELAELMQGLDIPSDTLYKQMHKRVAQSYLIDSNRSVVDTVNKEIEDAPTRSEMQAQQEQAQKVSMSRSLNRSVQGLAQQASAA